MSATIDTSMFSEYFSSPVIEVYGRTFPVQEYFLEDCVQMTNFVPPPGGEEEEGQGGGGGGRRRPTVTCWWGGDYSPPTRAAVARLSEKELSFDLVGALLRYVETLQVRGAVLVFLPGWNLIHSLQRHLQADPHFGSSRYLVLPLHSQIPREEQRRVFQPAPEGVTKRAPECAGYTGELSLFHRSSDAGWILPQGQNQRSENKNQRSENRTEQIQGDIQ
ncbi:ATP-dependent RNA helicase A-like [Menidia menidia]